MRKNGFTLAELLGVMVILSLISLITVPVVTDSLKKYRVSLCNSQINEIISAAKVWGTDNILVLPTTDGYTYTVNLDTLSKYGYIDKEIKNPITKKNFDIENTKVIITRVGKKYTYAIDNNTKNSCNGE